MTDTESPGRNAAPSKVQCAECHWVGLSSELAHIVRIKEGWADDVEPTLACPICNAPFARYPQRAEYLWSDPY